MTLPSPFLQMNDPNQYPLVCQADLPGGARGARVYTDLLAVLPPCLDLPDTSHASILEKAVEYVRLLQSNIDTEAAMVASLQRERAGLQAAVDLQRRQQRETAGCSPTEDGTVRSLTGLLLQQQLAFASLQLQQLQQLQTLNFTRDTGESLRRMTAAAASFHAELQRVADESNFHLPMPGAVGGLGLPVGAILPVPSPPAPRTPNPLPAFPPCEDLYPSHDSPNHSYDELEGLFGWGI